MSEVGNRYPSAWEGEWPEPPRRETGSFFQSPRASAASAAPPWGQGRAPSGSRLCRVAQICIQTSDFRRSEHVTLEGGHLAQRNEKQAVAAPASLWGRSTPFTGVARGAVTRPLRFKGPRGRQWGLRLPFFSVEDSIRLCGERAEPLVSSGPSPLSRQVLKCEVELMARMAKTIDSFTQNQTRLVVIIDGLDACEQDRVLQMLDTVRPPPRDL